MKLAIAVPAYNEEAILAASINQLVGFCQENFSFDWQVIIADNASTDTTSRIGKQLAAEQPQVRYLFVANKGKGAAIRAAWQSAEADVYCFMDADLATNLASLPRLIDTVRSGADLAIGSRFHKESQVTRSAFRKIFSWGYRLLARGLIGTAVHDLPCGFKACNSKVQQDIVPRIEHNAWFFDSELALLAEARGYRITEVPVIWRDVREHSDASRVQTFRLSAQYIQALIDVRKKIKTLTRESKI